MSTVTENAVGVAEMRMRLGVSKDTVYRLAREGTIPAFKVGRDWRFYPTQVVEALKSPVDLWAPPRRGRPA